MSVRKVLKMTVGKLKRTLRKELKRLGYDPQVERNYIWAEGTLPVVLVAHMDTVHKSPPRDIFYDPKHRVMWSPDGLGADDRAGVHAILRILDEGFRPHVLFTDLEECGGWGASDAGQNVDLPFGTKYVIEIDRRGYKQAVFYNEENDLFKNYILSFGFKEESGTYSDIVDLADAWGIACVNLSAGYVEEHRYTEHLYLDALDATISAVKKMLLDIENAPVYTHKSKRPEKRARGKVEWWEVGEYTTPRGTIYTKNPVTGEWEQVTHVQDANKACDFCSGWYVKDEMFIYEDERDGNTYTLCLDCARFVRDDMGKTVIPYTDTQI